MWKQCRVLECERSTCDAKANEVCTENKGEKLLGNPCEAAQGSRVLQFLIKEFLVGFICYTRYCELVRLSPVCCNHLWKDKMELLIMVVKGKRMESGQRN